MAGHAIAHMHLPTQKLLSAITINPTREQIFGKLFTYCPHDYLSQSNTQILINECKILLAGDIAEKALCGSTSSNNKNTCGDTCTPNTFNIAKIIVLDGANEDQLNENSKNDTEDKAKQLLQELEKEVTELLEQQKPLLMFIADTLVKQKTVTYDEIMFTLQQAYEQAAKENPELIKESLKNN